MFYFGAIPGIVSTHDGRRKGGHTDTVGEEPAVAPGVDPALLFEDTQMLTLLYERFRRPIYTYLYRLLGNQEDAAEWPLTRHNRDEEEESEREEETRAFLSADHGGILVVDEREHMQLALARLPHAYAVVLVLSVAQGIPYQEIASILGLSLGATASRLSRAKKMFVEQYQRIGQENDGKQEKRS